MVIIDNEGRIHRLGDTLSHVGERLPERYSVFSAGYAFLGLIAGGAASISICALIKLIFAVFPADDLFDYSSLEVIIRQVFIQESVFTTPVIVIAAVCAAVGFFWDGFTSTGEVYLLSFGTLGLLFGALIGLLLGAIILAVCEIIGTIPDLTSARIIVTAISSCAFIGFVWNGINACRHTFSVLRGFLGILCGILKGALVCWSALFSAGCFIIIIALIVAPATAVVGVLVILFFMFKGFFVIGAGGHYSDL